MKRKLCLEFDTELLKQMKVRAIELEITLTELLEQLMKECLKN